MWFFFSVGAQFPERCGFQIIGYFLAGIGIAKMLFLEFFFVFWSLALLFERDDQIVFEFVERVGFAVEPWGIESVEIECVFVVRGEFEEFVFGVDAVDEFVPDDAVQFRRPTFILVAGVGCDDEEEVDAEFAQDEGITVEKAVFEMLVGRRVFNAFLFIPYSFLQRMRAEVEVVFGDAGTDEKIRGDVVSLGQGIPVADVSFHKLVSGIMLLRQVQLVDVVLDGVFGVGELLVEGDAFRAVFVLVVFAVADEVDVGQVAYKGCGAENVVDEFAVVLLLEVFDAPGVTDEAVHHCFEDDFELADQQVLVRPVVVVLG